MRAKSKIAGLMQKIFRLSFCYVLVGICNTLVGYSVIFILIYLGFVPEIANMLGYIVGFINSYVLNKNFTFKSKNSHKHDLLRFGIAMGVAYMAQFIAMSVMYRYYGINVYFAQILGSGVYVFFGFIISLFFVFNPDRE